MSVTQAEAWARVRHYGADPTHFQVLNEGARRWIWEETLIGYTEAAGFWITIGPPVGPEAAAVTALRRFAAAARAAGRRVALFGVEPSAWSAWRAEGLRLDALKIGERPDWRPSAYHTQGPARRRLRAQLNRARNHGARVSALGDPARHAHHAEIEALLRRWRAGRRMSLMGFMVDLQPFTLAEARRIYIASRHGALVGLLSAAPVYGRQGIFIQDVIRDPRAPNGVAELLIDHALRDAAAHGDAFATLGLAPLAGLEGAEGRRPLLRLARLIAAHSKRLYDFEGLRHFKARLRPDAWTPQHLVALEGRVDARALYAVLVAFAGGHPLRFALDTLRRRMPSMARRLEAQG